MLNEEHLLKSRKMLSLYIRSSIQSDKPYKNGTKSSFKADCRSNHGERIFTSQNQTFKWIKRVHEFSIENYLHETTC